MADVTERRRIEIARLLQPSTSSRVRSLTPFNTSPPRRRGARTGLVDRVGPLGGDRCHEPVGNAVAGRHDPGIPLAGTGVLSAEVADPRRAHRDDGRRRGHRVLRGPAGLHALLPRDTGRLPRADARRRGRPPGLGTSPGPGRSHWSSVGCPPRGHPRVPVAPEAEGHGTDAAIAAVHHNPRGIRFRAVVVKIVASALTIGSGGSGGRRVRPARSAPVSPRCWRGSSTSARPMPGSPSSPGSARGSGPSSERRSGVPSWPPRSSTVTTSTPRPSCRASASLVGYVIFGAF